MPRVLIIDDEKSIRNTLKEILEYEGYSVDEAADGHAGLEKLNDESYDVVLCDIKMPKMDGLEVLSKAQDICPDTPFVMISGHGTLETAVEATKKGAYDFISKPPDLNRLLITLRNAIDKSSLVIETKVLKRKVTKTREIIGDSPAIQKIIETIEKVAPTDARVMITGENGTGKELVARWIHEKSNRNKSPLIEVNCAAIPSELIESELFGHEKGSFTSAIKQRIGKFEQAHGGTLFLDEIGDMSLSAQAKVLRALQENKITRVGGDKDIEVNVRVIAATNKDLLQEIDRGNFRMDLYHRLSVILIHLPSLNERDDDIPLLAEKFLKEICEDGGIPKKTFTPGALQELKKINWSGNIRELRNVVERLIILAANKITEEDVLSYSNPKSKNASSQSVYERFDRLQEFKDHVERIFIEEKLKKNGWNVAKTAIEIDIQRSHLYNKIDKYSLKRSELN
ncbi:MAG: sigma-54-dependent Fis family transcriptional regulator [Bacteroidia bacterium]|jgi:two-component system nitrogen regulation response regulator NtrX|nr:sigma-54-dependent Fis family transcriptional regulator [Bacteroidia bacterium]MBP7261803.1 sigma-54-dependent Fis family transcriptional regulator [Bacteroidia bacterium]MBP9180874.1 sigma-54-dependent Fis family transcriptional regulator [Bacteroidia bacterium]MBP9725129.1 sigma-54-dependent Fis family transcriptional regulator [Bacteroidia bacterium]